MSWYKDWFNSPYYHLLYSNRNEAEAEIFITNLLNHLQLKPKATVMDLACGKGRHSNFLAKNNLAVYGLDLAPDSIKEAQKSAEKNTTFAVHDMREVFCENYFDAIFSFFTSFGYFNDPDDDLKVFNSVYAQLKPEGVYVLDFMNTHLVKKNLVEKEHKQVGDVDFDIVRKVENGQIKKTITFVAQGKTQAYTEQVADLDLNYFLNLAAKSGFESKNIFGDYHLTPFDLKNSKRLIMEFHRI